MRRYFAEAIGTFVLVFAGTGALVIDDVSGGTVTHMGVAVTFGLAVLTVIYAVGDVSGAHINPAVTLGFWLSRQFQRKDVMPYVVAQCGGALVASGALRALFPSHAGFGRTAPAGPDLQSFALEVILTWFLMFVILSVATGAKEKGLMAGVAVGSVVALEALFAGPISGASMNPARSLGPAIVSWELQHLWIYIFAPIAGAVLGVGTAALIHGVNEGEVRT